MSEFNLSVEQYHTTFCRPGRSPACAQTKRSLAAPLRHRQLLLTVNPSARHTILLIAYAYQGIIARVSSVGNVNTRLPVAVKPTSMHVLVCTYEGPIYGRPLYYSCIVQCDDDTHTVRTT